jgi:uncharacterized protein (UPF0332 family)
MSFYWPEYFDLAKELSQSSKLFSSSEEARIRSAISRAYYAAFKFAYNHLRDNEKILMPYDTNAHWFVINEFSGRSDESQKIVGSNLERLRRLRNVADYQDNLYNPKRKIEEALGLAETVLKDIQNFKDQS